MILERYIYCEILSRLAWIVGLLVLVLASHRFVDYLGDAASGRLSADLIFEMLAMKMLAMLPRFLPAALFLSVILALSRLSRDRELTVVSSAGVRDRFVVFSVFKFSLVFSAGIVVISFYLAPLAEARLEALKTRAIAESDISNISPGRFQEFSGGDRIVYVKELSDDGGSMNEVFLRVRRENNQAGVVKSDSASYRIIPRTGSRYVLFEDGRRYVGRPGMRDYEITEYRTYAVLLERGEPRNTGRRLEEYSTKELWKLERPRYKAELQWRLSYVITTLLLPILAVAMNRFAFSEQKYTPIFIAILIYFVYSNLLGISKTLMVHDGFPLWLGVWWVHGLLLLIIIGLFELPDIQGWYRRRLKRKASKAS